jgi:hypothetical protein
MWLAPSQDMMGAIPSSRTGQTLSVEFKRGDDIVPLTSRSLQVGSWSITWDSSRQAAGQATIQLWDTDGTLMPWTMGDLLAPGGSLVHLGYVWPGFGTVDWGWWRIRSSQVAETWTAYDRSQFDNAIYPYRSLGSSVTLTLDDLLGQLGMFGISGMAPITGASYSSEMLRILDGWLSGPVPATSTISSAILGTIPYQSITYSNSRLDALDALTKPLDCTYRLDSGGWLWLIPKTGMGLTERVTGTAATTAAGATSINLSGWDGPFAAPDFGDTFTWQGVRYYIQSTSTTSRLDFMPALRDPITTSQLIIITRGSETTPVWTVQPGRNGTFVSSTRTLTDQDCYSVVYGTATAADGAALTATANITEGPLASTGPFGPVTYIDSSSVQNLQALQTEVQGLVDDQWLNGTTILDVTCLANPLIQQGDLVEIDLPTNVNAAPQPNGLRQVQGYVSQIQIGSAATGNQAVNAVTMTMQVTVPLAQLIND